jgi:hypothetical protein
MVAGIRELFKVDRLDTINPTPKHAREHWNLESDSPTRARLETANHFNKQNVLAEQSLRSMKRVVTLSKSISEMLGCEEA